MKNKVETIIVYLGNLGTMEIKMEATIVYLGNLGIMEKKENTIGYLYNLRIMEDEMETAIVDGFEVNVLPANYAWTMQDCVEVSRLAVLAMKNKAVYL